MSNRVSGCRGGRIGRCFCHGIGGRISLSGKTSHGNGYGIAGDWTAARPAGDSLVSYNLAGISGTGISTVPTHEKCDGNAIPTLQPCNDPR